MLSGAKRLALTLPAPEVLRYAQNDVSHFQLARPLAALAGEKGVKE
jgi:hypothetical protein